MNVPRISVVIPTRHRNDWLARCLDSLQPGVQTISAEEYEIIVTDDGTESTARAMLEAQYPSVKWTAGPHKGPAANRNHGASLAQGEWIAFVDDDCIPTPGWLKAYAELTAKGVPVLEGKTVCKAGFRSILDIAPVNETGGKLWGCNLMVATAFFRKIGGYNEAFAFWYEDVELNHRIRDQGVLPVFVPEAVVDHPPRKRPIGLKAARAWESRVQLEGVIGASSTAGDPLPIHIFKIRVSEALRAKWSWGTLLALYSAVVESLYVLFHIRQWRGTYRATGADLARG